MPVIPWCDDHGPAVYDKLTGRWWCFACIEKGGIVAGNYQMALKKKREDNVNNV